MKKYIILIVLMSVLTACGYDIDYKSQTDRSTFTAEELHEVEKDILNRKHVEDFSINYVEGGYYATLLVEDSIPSNTLESLIEDAFYSIKRETTDIVDLFVKRKSDGKILAQVFKPAKQDNLDNWTILSP